MCLRDKTRKHAKSKYCGRFFDPEIGPSAVRARRTSRFFNHSVTSITPAAA
jgi:hypothetical protein